MSTAAINPKGPRAYPAGQSPNAWANTYLASTVGRKILVAATGLLLVGFLVGHMIGNLKMFSGPESINKYAYFLKHDIGALIWIARGGLLLLFVAHLILAVRLRLAAQAARPVPYRVMKSAQATLQAKTMLWTGVVILAFTAYHLLHFTLGLVHPASAGGPDDYLTQRVNQQLAERNLSPGAAVNYLELRDEAGRHDVYAMVVAGFRTPYISAIYLMCQVLLLVHLSHGIQASLQTLGLVGKRFTPAAGVLGWAVAGTIFAGNVAIVAAVWAGYVK
jgi:succinate dehydrogenase / fumarate reductase cytochrome b subunit